MRLNIVTVDSGWILQKIAERADAHMPPGVECVITHEPYYATEDGEFSHYWYCDFQNCYHHYKERAPRAIHVAYFTHAHENSPIWMKNALDQQGGWSLDGMVSMNQRYTDMLRDVGWTKPILTTTPPANAGDFPLRKTRLLIANRGGFPGYGHDFMLSLSEGYEEFFQHNFEFTFVGNGWEPVIDKFKQAEIEVEHYKDSQIDYPNTYRKFYHNNDYLLVPILWTAGSFSAMEAHLTGLPIIASDVGLFNYEVEPEYCYPPGDKEALIEILTNIRSEIQQRRDRIIQLNDWNSYSEKIVNFMKGLKNGSS